MADAEKILEWLKEAGAYAFDCEDPERPGGPISVDVLVQGHVTVGVRVRRPAANWSYRNLTFSKLERAAANPLLKLIDETIASLE